MRKTQLCFFNLEPETLNYRKKEKGMRKTQLCFFNLEPETLNFKLYYGYFKKSWKRKQIPV